MKNNNAAWQHFINLQSQFGNEVDQLLQAAQIEPDLKLARGIGRGDSAQVAHDFGMLAFGDKHADLLAVFEVQNYDKPVALVDVLDAGNVAGRDNGWIMPLAGVRLQNGRDRSDGI
jgi:hypothetical protein